MIRQHIRLVQLLFSGKDSVTCSKQHERFFARSSVPVYWLLSNHVFLCAHIEVEEPQVFLVQEVHYQKTYASLVQDLDVILFEFV